MLTVRIFLDGKQIAPSQLPQITISNPTIDRVVNDIVDRTISSQTKEDKRSSQHRYVFRTT